MILTSDKIPGEEVERAADYASIRLSYEAIAKLLELPVGARIVGTADEFLSNSVQFKVVGLKIKPTPQGTDIVEIIPGQAGWSIRQ
jgi:hypothetical protein